MILVHFIVRYQILPALNGLSQIPSPVSNFLAKKMVDHKLQFFLNLVF